MEINSYVTPFVDELLSNILILSKHKSVIKSLISRKFIQLVYPPENFYESTREWA
jgi:hypothetical protein